MNTGHDGSMGTIHANTPRDCLGRLELLAGFAGFQVSEKTLRQNIASALDLIVQLERMPSGERRVTSVTEVDFAVDRLGAAVRRVRATAPQRTGAPAA